MLEESIEQKRARNRRLLLEEAMRNASRLSELLEELSAQVPVEAFVLYRVALSIVKDELAGRVE